MTKQKKEKRIVKVYKHECYFGTWWPPEHLPKHAPPIIGLESKEVEHDAFWPDGQEKHLHRIEHDGTKWYVRPPKYEDESFKAMIAAAKEKESGNADNP